MAAAHQIIGAIAIRAGMVREEAGNTARRGRGLFIFEHVVSGAVLGQTHPSWKQQQRGDGCFTASMQKKQKACYLMCGMFLS